MVKKNIILFIILTLLSSCGYTPIYKNITNNKLYIEVGNLEGDELINSIIFNNLNRYKNRDSNKKFILDIRTTSEKIVIAKDASGKTSNYQVNIITQIEIKSSLGTKIMIMKDEFKINNNATAFENLNYERSLKRNIASSFSEKIILDLINLE